jgi:hypothetical protein
MPATIFSIIPDVAVANPGDISLRTFANRSVVSELIRLLPDEDITLSPAFSNVSTFGADTRFTIGDEFNIQLNSAFANTSTFGAATALAVAPPDAIILLAAAFSNASIFGAATELTAAAADEIIRLAAAFVDADSFGSATFLSVDIGGGEGDDYDAIADGNPSGTVPD